MVINLKKTLPCEFIENYPDLLNYNRGTTNNRQREEYRRFLYRAIKTQLTQRQTQMIQMYYFEKYTMQAIATELNLNRGTVSRTIDRALNRLTQLAKVYFEISG